MEVRRREFLKLGVATAGAVAGVTATPARARSTEPADENCMGMLYDATKCIGCRACQGACRDGFDMPATPDGPNGDGLYDQPTDLSSTCPCIIQEYHSEDGEEWSFMKRQCMHCLDPGCASACLVNALERQPDGRVTYDVDKCIGCRYCMVACPFDVPTFEYEKAVPAIRKCTFCFGTEEEGIPRCVAACPTEAVKFGKREELLKEAWRRVHAEPGRYEHHVYGEHEAGGTAALYLAGVSFDKLGLPTNLPDAPIPNLTKAFLNSVPLVIILWAAFGTGLHRFVQRQEAVAREGEVAVPSEEVGP
jgi:Fe-S-cluster-containing dehydrogenase component